VILTEPRRRGLEVLAFAETRRRIVFESNYTSLPIESCQRLTVYWQTVRWLVAEQLATTRFEHGQWAVELTEAGRAVLAEEGIPA
jgi:hypothetical protein